MTSINEENKSLLKEEEEHVEDVRLPPRRIGFWNLLVLSFFITAGGPFGFEGAVATGGPILCMAGLLVSIVLWCIPQLLMSAELSLLLPENGGSIVWVDRAFGGGLSFLNMCNLLFANLCAMTVAVVLFVEYIPVDPLGVAASAGIAAAVIVVGGAINWMGARVVSVFTSVVSIFMFVPFVCMLGVLGSHKALHLHLSASDVPSWSHLDAASFVAALIWTLGNFDSVGALAGEVRGGRSTFISSTLLSIPMSYVNYIGPMLIALMVVPFTSAVWTNQGYVGIAALLSSSSSSSSSGWLQVLMSVAALSAMLGQVVSGISYGSRQIDACGRSDLLPSFFALSHLTCNVYRPTMGIIVTMFSMFALSFLPFYRLTQLFLLQRVISLVFEYAALLRLRCLEPEAARPFRAPWPYVLGVPTLFLGAFTLVSTRDRIVWITSASLEVFFILAYLGKQLYHKMRFGSFAPIIRRQ